MRTWLLAVVAGGCGGDADAGTDLAAGVHAGVDASVLGPAEFGAFLRTEFEKWGKVVRDTGATVN